MAKSETQNATSVQERNTPPGGAGANGKEARHNGSHNGHAQGGQSQSSMLAKPRQDQSLQRRDTLLADPFATMQRLAAEMDGLFSSFGFGRSPWLARHTNWSMPSLSQMAWSPQLEVEERDNQLVVRLDLPGLNKEDVQISVADDVLTISGERKQEREEKREGFYHSERSYGNFQRSIPLPDGVNPDQVKANFRNGVLEVTMPAPQRQASNRRQIEVQG